VKSTCGPNAVQQFGVSCGNSTELAHIGHDSLSHSSRSGVPSGTDWPIQSNPVAVATQNFSGAMKG
jgi:hypothetical protein